MSWAHRSRMGRTSLRGADGTRKTHSVTPMSAKCSSLPGSGSEPNGTICSVDGSRPGVGHDAPQLGDGLGQTGAADGDPAVGVLGDVGEQLRPGPTADQHRDASVDRLGPRPARADVRRGRRRTRRRPRATAPAWPARARGLTLRRVAQATPWSAISSSFQPKPMPSTKRPPESRSSVATALAVTIGSRWAGSRMPVPRMQALGDRGGGGEGHERVDGALVLLGQLGVAGGRRRAAADRGCGCARAGRASGTPRASASRASSTTLIERSVANIVTP